MTIGVKPCVDYLPWWFKDVAEVMMIMPNDDNIVEFISNQLDVFEANRFIQTAEIGIIVQWENLLSIEADPANETIEFRRQRILTRLSLSLPYTTPYLRRRLDQLVGADSYSLSIDYNNYTINLSLRISQEALYDEILTFIHLIKPANMVFNTTFIYNTHEEVGRHTHGELAAYTHYQIATLEEIRT